MTKEQGGNQRGRLFVVSGPSGAGKSTLCREVLKVTDARVSVSATTRPRTDQEVGGEDYVFLTEEQFRAQIADGEFLEYALVFGNYYGTPAGPVREMLDAGRTVILEIDVQGAAQVFAKTPEAIGVFVLPPNDEELRRRLSHRGRDETETIEKRLAKAAYETETAQQDGHYRHFVVNDDLQATVDKMKRLIERKD